MENRDYKSCEWSFEAFLSHFRLELTLQGSRIILQADNGVAQNSESRGYRQRLDRSGRGQHKQCRDLQA